MRTKYKNNASLSESPHTGTFDFANRQPELRDHCSCSISNTSHHNGSNTRSADLANMTQLVTTIAAAFSQFHASPSDSLVITPWPLSPLVNNPTKLSRYLQYVQDNLSVDHTTQYEY